MCVPDDICRIFFFFKFVRALLYLCSHWLRLVCLCPDDCLNVVLVVTDMGCLFVTSLVMFGVILCLYVVSGACVWSGGVCSVSGGVFRERAGWHATDLTRPPTK